jgi:outer membrane beta-barrel protein
MKKIRIVLLATAAALCSYPVTAFAQDDAEETGEGESAGEGEAEASGEEGEEAGEEGEASDKKEEENLDAELAGDEGGLGNICQIDPEACPQLDIDKEAARQIREPLYAVQQIFVMRARRFEFMPYYGFTLNDQFVSHNAPGLGLNYWITNVLAVGVNGNYHAPFNTDSSFNFQTRRAARVNVPLSEYQWSAALNFTYSPIMGKFSGFGDFIFQYDAYVVGGVGLLASRPVPVIDPDNRLFESKSHLAFNAGLGIHIFFNRWFAANLEVRDYIFNDQLEAIAIAKGEAAADPTTWLEDKGRLTNGVQAQLGLSVFLPFSFEYRLPK